MTKLYSRSTRSLVAAFALTLLPFSTSLPAAPTGTPETSVTIVALLSAAKRALQDNRLTIPSGDNAVTYAQRVLDLSPGHSAAQQVLREVVARYGVIADLALKRAETLRTAEIAKARSYGERGMRVATRYRLSELALQKVQDRIAVLEADPAGQLGAPSGRPSGRDVLSGVVARYVTDGEAALGAGQVLEARRYLDIAQILARDYRLSSPGLPRLGERVAEAEQQLLHLVQSPPAPTAATVRLREVATPFLPPAF